MTAIAPLLNNIRDEGTRITMKILQFVSLLGTGGVERQVLYLVDGMTALGHEVQIVVLRDSSNKSVFRSSVPTHSLGMTKSPIGILRSFWRARQLIREFKPDVIHSHMFHACIFTRLLKLVAPIPYLVCTPHLSFTPLNRTEGGKSHILAYRVTDRLANLTTNVGEEATKSFVRAGATPASRIRTVYNGFDTVTFHPDRSRRKHLREELGISDEHFLWLAAGRLSPQKDYPNMITAFQTVVAAHPNSRLYIAGNGPLEEDCRKLVSSLGSDEAVKFIGARSDMPDLMAAADGYVMSSAWEGLPMVIGEAMASGLPAVATDCGGVAELIGDAGWLVPPEDPVALAEGMIKVAAMPLSQRIAIGSKARERICNTFSLTGKCEEWITLYSAGKSDAARKPA